MNQHVRARQRVNLTVELDAVELLGLNLTGLLRLHTAGLANHVRHGLHEEAAGTARGIQNAVIHVHFENLVHEVRDVLGREYLPRFGFLLVTIELVEKDAHYVLAAPLVRVDALGNLDDPVDEIIDCLLIVGRVHLDVGILLQQDVNLHILLAAVLQRLGECRVNRGVERRISQILQALQPGTVPLGDQRTRRENHAVIEVLNAELEMQAVVNTRCQLVDALLVDAIDGIERQVITGML